MTSAVKNNRILLSGNFRGDYRSRGSRTFRRHSESMRFRIYAAMCVSIFSIIFSIHGIMSYAGSPAETVNSDTYPLNISKTDILSLKTIESPVYGTDSDKFRGTTAYGSSFNPRTSEIRMLANSLKYYEVLEVKKGDTLYELARPFYDSRFYSSYESFLNEIRFMNRMAGDTIYPGRVISVPCYLH